MKIAKPGIDSWILIGPRLGSFFRTNRNTGSNRVNFLGSHVPNPGSRVPVHVKDWPEHEMHRLRVLRRHLTTAAIDARKEPSNALKAARRQGHSVPQSMKNARSAVTYFDNGATRLSHAEQTRSLIASLNKKTGTLCTTHHLHQYPYGSVINFTTLHDGRIVTFVSKLAEHSANIAKDPRASLLVSQVQGLNSQAMIISGGQVFN